MLDGCKYSHLVDSIEPFLFSEISHVDLLESVVLPINLPRHMID